MLRQLKSRELIVGKGAYTEEGEWNREPGISWNCFGIFLEVRADDVCIACIDFVVHFEAYVLFLTIGVRLVLQTAGVFRAQGSTFVVRSNVVSWWAAFGLLVSTDSILLPDAFAEVLSWFVNSVWCATALDLISKRRKRHKNRHAVAQRLACTAACHSALYFVLRTKFAARRPRTCLL